MTRAHAPVRENSLFSSPNAREPCERSVCPVRGQHIPAFAQVKFPLDSCRFRVAQPYTIVSPNLHEKKLIKSCGKTQIYMTRAVSLKTESFQEPVRCGLFKWLCGSFEAAHITERAKSGNAFNKLVQLGSVIQNVHKCLSCVCLGNAFAVDGLVRTPSANFNLSAMASGKGFAKILSKSSRNDARVI